MPPLLVPLFPFEVLSVSVAAGLVFKCWTMAKLLSQTAEAFGGVVMFAFP